MGRFSFAPAEVILSVGIVALLGLVFLLGMKYLELLPVREPLGKENETPAEQDNRPPEVAEGTAARNGTQQKT